MISKSVRQLELFLSHRSPSAISRVENDQDRCLTDFISFITILFLIVCIFGKHKSYHFQLIL
jgi:hypothetical protein